MVYFKGNKLLTPLWQSPHSSLYPQHGWMNEWVNEGCYKTYEIFPHCVCLSTLLANFSFFSQKSPCENTQPQWFYVKHVLKSLFQRNLLEITLIIILYEETYHFRILPVEWIFFLIHKWNHFVGLSYMERQRQRLMSNSKLQRSRGHVSYVEL